MNSRTYDQMTDKFMDLSIEKTHSAYMLFYERIEKTPQTIKSAKVGASCKSASPIKRSTSPQPPQIKTSEEMKSNEVKPEVTKEEKVAPDPEGPGPGPPPPAVAPVRAQFLLKQV